VRGLGDPAADVEEIGAEAVAGHRPSVIGPTRAPRRGRPAGVSGRVVERNHPTTTMDEAMTGSKKAALLILGFVTVGPVVSQFVMGMLILRGHSAGMIKAHERSGYLTALVAIAYVGWSLSVIASIPSRPKP